MSVVSRLSLPMAALAIASIATGASALSITSAEVTGPSGTIWTTKQTVNYTLFVQTPGLGDFVNPNGEMINVPVSNSGITRALLAGEGFTPGTTVDSDAIYTLTLGFDGGQTLTGTYVPLTNTFTGGGNTIMSGNSTFSLIEFSYRRFLGDSVQANVATPGGDGNDYNGNFRLSAVAGAVPEPATWGLMLVGFTMVGAAARRRNRVSVTA